MVTDNMSFLYSNYNEKSQRQKVSRLSFIKFVLYNFYKIQSKNDMPKIDAPNINAFLNV